MWNWMKTNLSWGAKRICYVLSCHVSRSTSIKAVERRRSFTWDVYFFFFFFFANYITSRRVNKRHRVLPHRMLNHHLSSQHTFWSRPSIWICKDLPAFWVCSSRKQVCVKSKCKAVPLQAWSGPEGSRNLRFPDFMTTAQKVGKYVSLTHRPHLPPGNPPGTHLC
jgi:hypothetical protein